jgi:hypothetical protein
MEGYLYLLKVSDNVCQLCHTDTKENVDDSLVKMLLPNCEEHYKELLKSFDRSYQQEDTESVYRGNPNDMLITLYKYHTSLLKREKREKNKLIKKQNKEKSKEEKKADRKKETDEEKRERVFEAIRFLQSKNQKVTFPKVLERCKKEKDKTQLGTMFVRPIFVKWKEDKEKKKYSPEQRNKMNEIIDELKDEIAELSVKDSHKLVYSRAKEFNLPRQLSRKTLGAYLKANKKKRKSIKQNKSE